jgi:hypothetical protein
MVLALAPPRAARDLSLAQADGASASAQRAPACGGGCERRQDAGPSPASENRPCPTRPPFRRRASSSS